MLGEAERTIRESALFVSIVTVKLIMESVRGGFFKFVDVGLFILIVLHILLIYPLRRRLTTIRRSKRRGVNHDG